MGIIRENFLRARLYTFERVSRSRELLACTFTPFWAGFAFARTSCVHVYTLLGGFRVHENFLRARLHPFGRVSRSRELLAYTFTPFWMGFAFARTSAYTFTLFLLFLVFSGHARVQTRVLLKLIGAKPFFRCLFCLFCRQ
jgi:hypothetical protein